jgi:hypothetical protein
MYQYISIRDRRLYLSLDIITDRMRIRETDIRIEDEMKLYENIFAWSSRP